jgi:hypothetical protein
MSLDISACLKAFSVAFCQYSNHPNEQTLKCVERQMDVSSLSFKFLWPLFKF